MRREREKQYVIVKCREELEIYMEREGGRECKT